jgi:ATP-dependent Clp protease ATP-binding subunit ClpA
MFVLPEGLVQEAKPLARELGIRADDRVERLLLALLTRRNDVLMVVLADQRLDASRVRRELQDALGGMPAEPSPDKLTWLLNQAVALGTRLTKSVTPDHLTLSVLEHHPNAASRFLEAKGVKIEDAKRIARAEITADGSRENPEMTARRFARRIEQRCRIQFNPIMLNKLWILAEQYLPGPDRNRILRQFLQTIAAEALQEQLPAELRNLQVLLTEAKVRAQKAEETAGSSTRRRTIEEEVKSRDNYLKSLADWIESQRTLMVSDDAVRRAISTLAKMPVEKVDLL